LSVIFNHTWPEQGLNPVLTRIVQLPWMLMDGFFVLSGFLITGILLDSRSRPDYYKSYYVRRTLRILPIYYLVITFLTSVAMFHGHAPYKQMLAQWGSPGWFFVYLGNIPTALTGFYPMAAGGAYIPLWSLQVEEQFYLLFPLLVHRVRMETLGRLLLGLACFSTILRIAIYYWNPANLLAPYVLLPCRMEGLALGGWIAIRFRMGPWNIRKNRLMLMTAMWVTIACMSAIWGGYAHITPFNRTIGLLLSPIAFAHVVLWLVLFRGSRLTAPLRLAPVQYLGKISYAAYLFHWPIGDVLGGVSAAAGIHFLERTLPRMAAIYIVTFICAALSWHFLEKPLLGLKDRWYPPRSLQGQT
jgi:peptidoglycan/LPS O-acetylase OafA/YrhL